LAFRTEATCYTAVEGEGQNDQKSGQEGLQTGLHLSARFDNRADDHQSAPRAARGRQASRLVCCEVFEDAGISGAKGRKDRPTLDALLKSVSRREVDMVAAWSVDRLGRSLTDLLDFLRELHAKGVDLFLHQQGLDTSTPSGRAMFQMMGVFAEFRILVGTSRLAALEGSEPCRRPDRTFRGSWGQSNAHPRRSSARDFAATPPSAW
jgi:Resolvase, N terminal domain